MLVAPPGYGKSTLAATYARESGGAVAWLTVHPADRDSRRLFSELADSLERGFEQPDALPELRKGLADGAEGVGLARLLVTDLRHAPAGFIIVFDDFHLVGDSEDVVASVDALIRELPEAGQVIITAREAPALSMTRYVVEGSVFPLGTADLQFSPEETRDLRGLIRQADAAREPGTEADAEAARTRRDDEDRRDAQAEGWVAGILLGGAPRQLGARGGTLLGGYVEREILARLSPTECAWLESLSVFDLITPQAAERMCGAGPWQARLLGLAERCPFLVPRNDGTFRLHGLLRDTVLNRLRRSPDDRWVRAWSVVKELAEEAADPVTFVDACQELGQIEGAVDLIRRLVAVDFQAARWSAGQAKLQLLPEEIRRSHPDLSLVEARALLNTGHPHRAHEAAESALSFGGRTGDESVQVQALIELATITMLTDIVAAEDWLSAAEHILTHSTTELPDRRRLEGRALAIRGILRTEQGANAEARDAFEASERLLKLLGPSRDLAMVQQNFGAFCDRTGDYATAQVTLESAAAHWRLVGDRNGLATTRTILGDLLLRLGNVEAAGAALDDAVRSAQAIGALRMEAFATVSLGQWHRASGRIDEAVAAFDDGIKLAEDIVERELLAYALAYRAEMAILQEDPRNRKRRLLARAQTEAQLVGSSRVLATVERALGRLHLADQAASEAITYFQSALDRGGSAWGPDERAETLYWLGVANLTLKQTQTALACLDQAVTIAMQAGLPAMLAGPAAEDPCLLDSGKSHGREVAFLGDVDKLAATRRPWSGATAPSRPVVVVRNDLPRVEVKLFGSFELHVEGELVSKALRKDRVRELGAVLVLHASGLPDTDIAEMMFPDFEVEKARHNLQMATYGLRHLLGSSAAVQYSARTYQLNPRLPLVADVRQFDAALATAPGKIGEPLIQALTRACELFQGPLIRDAAWHWLENLRNEYTARYTDAALRLAAELAPIDAMRSDGYALTVLTAAPATDLAYERLILNARRRRDADGARRAVKQYLQAAEQYGFQVDRALLDEQTGRTAR